MDSYIVSGGKVSFNFFHLQVVTTDKKIWDISVFVVAI